MKQGIRGAVELIFHPILGYFGPRFENLNSRLDKMGHHTADLDIRMQQVQNDVQSMIRRLDDFERHISTDIQTSVEVLLTHQRSTAVLQERISELQDLVQRLSLHPATAEENQVLRRDESAASEGEPLDLSPASS